MHCYGCLDARVPLNDVPLVEPGYCCPRCGREQGKLKEEFLKEVAHSSLISAEVPVYDCVSEKIWVPGHWVARERITDSDRAVCSEALKEAQGK